MTVQLKELLARLDKTYDFVQHFILASPDSHWSVNQHVLFILLHMKENLWYLSLTIGNNCQQEATAMHEVHGFLGIASKARTVTVFLQDTRPFVSNDRNKL